MLEVSDETDAYAVLVVFVGGVSRYSAMSAVLLSSPSGSDFDFSVWGIGTVANDEMIAQFVHSVASVCSIKSSGTAVLGGAVVNDDVLPAI